MKPQLIYIGGASLYEHIAPVPIGVVLKHGDYIRLSIFPRGERLEDATFELSFESAQIAEWQKEKNVTTRRVAIFVLAIALIITAEVLLCWFFKDGYL